MQTARFPLRWGLVTSHFQNNLQALIQSGQQEVVTALNQGSVAYQVTLECSQNESRWHWNNQSGIFPHGSDMGLNTVGSQKKLYMLYGLGDGEFANRLRQNPLVCELLIFEPSVSLLQSLLEQVDLRPLILDSKVRFVVGVDETRYVSQLESYFFQKIYRFCYAGFMGNLIAPGVEKISAFKDYSVKFAKAVNTAVQNVRARGQFSKEDSFLGLRNAISHYQEFGELPELTILKDSFKGKDAAVIVPGPSLQKSLGHLKEVQNQLVLICCDSALDILMQNGITPDFICTLERGPEIQHLLKKNPDVPACYIVPSVIHPKVFKAFKGQKIAVHRDTSVDGWLYPGRERFFLGQTVSQMALQVAHILGCHEINLVGVDCAFDPHTGQSHNQNSQEWIEDHASWIKNESDFTVVDIEGYDGQPKKTWTLWLLDSYIIRDIVAQNQLKVNRITPIDYGLPIEGTTRVDPDFLLSKKNNSILEKHDLVTTVLKSKKTQKIQLNLKESSVQYLIQLQRDLMSALNDMNLMPYDHPPMEAEAKSVYDQFFAKMMALSESLLAREDRLYERMLHNILQGEFAESYYQIYSARTEEKSHIYIDRTLKQYRHWFEQLLLWAHRVQYTIETTWDCDK